MHIQDFYDARTNTLTYVVHDPQTRDAVIIDPVLDYDPASSRIWRESVDVVLDYVEREQLKVHYVLETHAHADHLSGAQLIKQAHPEATLAIGARITEVQAIFKGVFELPEDFPTDGRQFDKLLEDREVFEAGSLRFEVIFTPGHTPACASYRIEDAVFVGDTVFMPDSGTGRCDFPGGSATDLYDSIQRKLYAMGDDTRIFVGHDYQPGGRPVRHVATVREHKEGNVALPASRSEQDFVTWREARDATLNAPKLLFQSVQVNVDAGHLPKTRYLKIPLNAFRPEGDGELSLDRLKRS